MRKLSLMLLLFMILFLVNGCQLIVLEEDSIEYETLSDQYNKYLDNDIADYTQFMDIMNQATDVTTTSVFMIEIHVLDVFNRITKRTYGSGTLVYSDSNYHYILTTYEMLDLDARFIEYQAYDAYGTQLSATYVASNESLKLGLLKVPFTDYYYADVHYPKFNPLFDELVLTIINDFPTQNLHKLGLYNYQDDIFYMVIEQEGFVTGSPVFNLDLELVGIQYRYETSRVELIDYLIISDFVNEAISSK